MSDRKRWDDLTQYEREQINNAFRAVDSEDKSIEEKNLKELFKETFKDNEKFDVDKLSKDILKQLGVSISFFNLEKKWRN